MPKDIGTILRELRADRPRKEVAAAIRVSYAALQMYENNRRVPRDEIKVRIADYYHKPVGDIFYP